MRHMNFLRWTHLATLALSGMAGSVRAEEEFPHGLSAIRVRDPFIYADSRTKRYYLYAQTANRLEDPQPGLGVEACTSPDLERWSQAKLVFRKPREFWGGDQIWAPEVHRIGNQFFMFVSFDGREGGRGTQILKASRPDGPFEICGLEANTPPEERALDGTPWIDRKGRRWMVYCHEWVQIGNGAMKAVPMSDDFSHRAGEPVRLFRAADAPWVRNLKSRLRAGDDNYVTDGPCLYRTKDRTLLMLWSSFTDGGYAVGIAKSKTGRIEGPWIQQGKPFSAKDGGHCMIFKTFDGRLLLALHRPNGGRKERAHLFLIEDTGDSLRLIKEVTPEGV